MDTLNHILSKYNLDIARRMPSEIANVGRDDLAILFAELGFSVGVEVGVERGVYTEVLCRANPQAKIYGVDAWQHYDEYRDHVSQEKLDGFYEDAAQRLAPYDCELIRKFSLEAARDFEPESLDFVYIDGNHSLEYVIEDISRWSKRVRPDGIVSGHDYRKSKTSYVAHVVHAVQAYTDAYRIRPWFVLGRKAIVQGEVRDRNRSWMWVKT